MTDRPELVHDRGKIFDAIREHKITPEQIQSSDLYYKIADRVDMLPLLESIIDSNDTIFKYNRKLNAYSLIKANYIMKNVTEGQILFLFLAETGEEGRYFCRSFFPQDKMDCTIISDIIFQSFREVGMYTLACFLVPEFGSSVFYDFNFDMELY